MKSETLYPHERLLQILGHPLIIFMVIPLVATIAFIAAIIVWTTTEFQRSMELSLLAILVLAFLFFVFREW